MPLEENNQDLNHHSKMDELDSNMHYPKQYKESETGVVLTKGADERLDYMHRNHLKPTINIVDINSAPPTEVNGDVYILSNAVTTLSVDSIAWQSGNTIRIQFGVVDLSAVSINDWFITTGNANSSNDGTFQISAVNDGSDYIDITNPNRTDATDDEGSPASGTGYITIAAWDGGSANMQVQYYTYDDSWFGIDSVEGDIGYIDSSSEYRIFDGTDWSTVFGAGANTNLATDNLTQDPENRTYSGNNFNLEFQNVNGFGIETTGVDSSAALQIDSTSKAFVMPRMNEAQRDAIPSPITGAKVYNTDVDRFNYYNGVQWVDIGFGDISVVRGGDGGIPTYFTDLQDALETCKTTGSNNTITLHNNIILSAQIDVNSSGSGTGNGYDYKMLTINLNGFEITFDDVGGDDVFNISFLNASGNDQTINFVNGKVSRLNGDGLDYGLHFPSTSFGNIQMSNMIWYCQNGGACRVTSTTATIDNFIHNFGNSLFTSEGIINTLYVGSSVENFKCKNTSTGNAFSCVSANIIKNFSVEANSGIGCLVGSVGTVTNFHAVSNSGIALNLDNDSITRRCSYFTAISISDYAISAGSNNDRLSFFNAYSNTSIYACSFSSGVEAQHGKIVSNTGIGAYAIASTMRFVDCTSISGTSSCRSRENSVFESCNFTGLAGYGANLTDASNVNNSVFKNCNFTSKYNNAAGHSVHLAIGTGTAYFINSTFETTNASANCLYSASAVTISYAHSSFRGATTSVNANITQGISNSEDSQGNITI